MGLVAVVTLVVALVATFALAGPGPKPRSHQPTVTTTTIPASFAVGETTENWTDNAPGATTEDFATGQTTAGRHLLTEIFYPTTAGGSAATAAAPVLSAPPATKYGPYPVIVFAHGYDLLPSTYQAMLDAWVQAGFVVAAPIFPVDNANNIKLLGGWSNQNAIDAEDDVFHEPDDVAFVVDQLASAAADTTSPLHGLIDMHRLALAGQSDGANVIGALVYDQAYRSVYDQMAVRPGAVAILSGAPFARANQTPADVYVPPSPAPPELSSESTGDYCNPQGLAIQLYSKVGGTKWFLVIEGATHLSPYGASHLAPYTGKSPWAGPTVSAITAFFERELGWRSASAATHLMATAGNTPNLTRLVAGGAGPAVASPPAADAPPNHVACGLQS